MTSAQPLHHNPAGAWFPVTAQAVAQGHGRRPSLGAGGNYALITYTSLWPRSGRKTVLDFLPSAETTSVCLDSDYSIWMESTLLCFHVP